MVKILKICLFASHNYPMILFYVIAHQTVVLDLRVVAVEVALDPVHLPVAHLVVHQALQLALETEGENVVVAKVLMPHEGMITKRRRERRNEKGTEIVTEIGTVNRKRRRAAILFLKNLNPKGDPGMFIKLYYFSINWQISN